MQWKIVRARTTKITRATTAARHDLEHYCRDLNGWPRSWMGLEKDLPPGEQLLALFRPFLEHLAASDLSPKTIQKHVDNMWALGGEFIRDLHSDSSLRKKPVELVLRQMIEYDGPLLYHGGEDQQRSFDSTCRNFHGFLTKTAPWCSPSPTNSPEEAFVLLAGVTLSSGFAQIITTVAGTGTDGYNGDGGPANKAQLNLPTGLGVDGSGNVYVVDMLNNRIRKISTSGIITTVAGNGTPSYVGPVPPDGTATQLAESPVYFTVRQDGTIYFDDFFTKKVDPSGNLTVIDRNLAIAPTALSLDRSGTLYFAVGNTVKKYTPNGVPQLVAGPGTAGVSGDNGSSLQGNFFVSGLASDADGNIYIADGQNNRVRKFAPGGNITTVAGNGKAGFSGDGGPAQQAQLNGPVSVALDASGNMYIADNKNGRVRKVDPSGTITTVAGQGGTGNSTDGIPAVQDQLSGVDSVAVDDSGNLYITQSAENRVRKVSFQTTLTVPQISTGGVTNAASYGTVLAPGELFSIFGTNLASATASAASVPLPMTLAGTSVTVNGKPAPLVFVSPTQINAQIPYEVTMLDPSFPFPSVVVTSGGVASLAAKAATLLGSAPGIFQYGTNRAVAQNQDNSINASDKPAKVGSTIIVYMTGGGELDNKVATGAGAGSNPLSRLLQPITVTIGGQPATVSFAGLTPGFVGLVQVNLVVPALASGSYPVVLKANAFTSNAPLITVTALP